MKHLVLAALAAVLGAVLAPAALAKGPSAARIEGPGLQDPILIKGFSEPGNASPLGQLVESGGFFPAVFGQTPDPMSTARPAGDLGPRYRVVFTVPGPDSSRSTIVQDMYPYATPRAVTYMRPGQSFWDGQLSHGGWFEGGPSLRNALVTAGLPTSAPGNGSGWSWPATTLVSLGGALLIAAVLLLIRSRLRLRPEGGPQPV